MMNEEKLKGEVPSCCQLQMEEDVMGHDHDGGDD
jgi:hypothetical protein